MTFRVDVLGPLLITEGSSVITLRRFVERGLLAVAALHPDEPLGADRVVDRLWSEDVPAGAHQKLRAAAGTLRSLVEPHSRRGWSWSSAPDGSYFRLQVPEEASDLLLARRGALAARQATRLGLFTRASQEAHAALRLWRGPVLADLARSREWPELARLREEWWQLTEDRLRADLECGQTGLAGQLERLARSQPRRERLWATLMAAWRGAGRPEEADSVYREAQAMLAEGWGLDPGPELSRERALLDSGEDCGHGVDDDPCDGLDADPVTILRLRVCDGLAAQRAERAGVLIDDHVRRCLSLAGGEIVWAWDHDVIALFAGAGQAMAALTAALAVRDALRHSDGTSPDWLRLAVLRHHRTGGEMQPTAIWTGPVVDPRGMRYSELLISAGRGAQPIVDRGTYSATRTIVEYRPLRGATLYEAAGLVSRRAPDPSGGPLALPLIPLAIAGASDDQNRVARSCRG